MEQSLSTSDVLTLIYVGTDGRKLMRKAYYFAPNSNFANPGLLDVMRNAATSNYNALQAQYRHRVSHGLQSLLSYTWSHSIYDASSDANWVNVPPGHFSVMERAFSDYDVRNTFSGAASYDIPSPSSGVLKQILGNWSSDSINLCPQRSYCECGYWEPPFQAHSYQARIACSVRMFIWRWLLVCYTSSYQNVRFGAALFRVPKTRYMRPGVEVVGVSVANEVAIPIAASSTV